MLFGMGAIDSFDINNFMPIFGYNYNTTFLLGLQNLFILNFMWLYFFIMPKLKRKDDFKSIIFISFIVNIILIIIAIIAILSVFPLIATETLPNIDNLNTVYLITRKIQLNSFIEQTDILFLGIWTLSIFGYISFFIYGITYILNKLFNFENKSQIVFPITSILLGFCLLSNKIDIITFLENNIFKYFSIILIFGISFIILILGNLKRKRKESKLHES